MSRLALLAAATLCAGAAHAQRVDIAAQLTGVTRPYPVQTGQLVAGEISPGDYVAGPDWNGDVLVLTLRAGEAVTAQLKSDIPGLELHVHAAKSHTGKALVEGPATTAPLRFVAPAAGDYLVFVHARGPQRFGKYLLAIGSDAGAPAFDPPKPPPVQVAAAAPAPPKPAGPLTPPPLPKIPGVINAKTGETLSRPAAPKPGASTEMFQFLAAGGSDLKVSVTGAGPLALRLYTSAGEEILSTTGDAILRLDAIAPTDDLYFLGVSRADATKPYRLNLEAKEVDALAAITRWGVGYQSLDDKGQPVRTSCWLQPGVKQRRSYADGRVAVITYLGAGRSRSENSAPGKPSNVAEWTIAFDGETAVQTFASGTVTRYRPFGSSYGAYAGYLCK